ncbi:flavin reductase family protein [Xenophilus sp. Marseille-Q4582]|uniref:flavin reductase family protein n=1 Tax=Xenophilus sp. Marseille-Q4582 TaxID=2866600 RepID=UPI001CE44956|nr:flavin reductase family protein [Xenophilus sp. Marseille-Q4582]
MSSSSAFRQPVPLDRAYRLLNHGPTVLVSAATQGRRNLMAAAWAMPLDFAPPKVAVVLDKSTYTRQLLEQSGHFALQVPVRAQIDVVNALGNVSGADAQALHGRDKFEAFGLTPFDGPATGAPLVEGCAAWLECRLLPEPAIQARYDLFLGEVVAAAADARVFSQGRWHFEGHDDLRTLHHVAGGHFLLPGEALDAQALSPIPPLSPLPAPQAGGAARGRA